MVGNKKLFVEGGGDSETLHSECRKGFRTFLEKAGLKNKMPRIIACGGRTQAVDRFLSSIGRGETAFLLIDSENNVPSSQNSIEFLSAEFGDLKDKQDLADRCHLMVVCMETWFLADQEALAEYFSTGFDKGKLPQQSNIETISKHDLFESLKKSTRNTKTKGEYDKGTHSFKILAAINPALVLSSSTWAKRFVEKLNES